MPQTYQNRQGTGTTQAPTRPAPTRTTGDDTQDTLGNEAVQDSIRAQGGSTGQDASSGQSTTGAWASGVSPAIAPTTQQISKPKLAQGRKYKLTAEDMQWQESATWTKVARDHGMSADHLVAFNQQVETVNAGTEAEQQVTRTPTLAAGVELYIPSSDEVLFSQICHRTASMEAAVAEWGKFANSSHRKILENARDRASGKVGKGYGTAGDDGIFYTQNPGLAGASSKRSELVNGDREYRISWGADFWKCSVFMHDVVYSSGYKPDMTDNKHYRLAGQLHQSGAYKEVKVDAARPGNLWQRFGGTGSNESHNAVLSSFVTVESVDDEWERWTFDIIGAEDERAAESTRSHVVKKGTNETDEGKRIRFFEPRSRR